MQVCGIFGLLLFGGLALIVYFVTVSTVCLCHEGKYYWYPGSWVRSYNCSSLR